MGSRGASSGSSGRSLGEGMRGSEKQVAWAKDILQKEMDGLERNTFLRKVGRGGSSRGTRGDKEYYVVSADAYSDAQEFMPRMRSTIVGMSKSNSAKQIIDSRDRVSGMVDRRWSDFKALRHQERSSGKRASRKGEVVLEYSRTTGKVARRSKVPSVRG